VSSINGIFRSRPAFSLFAILAVAPLRLRLQNRCGLGLNRNLSFLDGHWMSLSTGLDKRFGTIGSGENPDSKKLKVCLAGR
jgi:hypothetical protein